MPDNLILVPSSTPFGILVNIFFLLCFLPIPWQSLHGLEICSPAPAHSGQVCWIVKKPWLDLTWPCPPQVEQEIGLEPGSAPDPSQFEHLSEDEKLISCFLPLYASSSVIDKSYLKSAPLKLEDLLLPLDPPKPSKKSSKGSEPKISEKIFEKSKFENPPLPPELSKAACPNWS